jgi:hypothetical protein
VPCWFPPSFPLRPVIGACVLHPLFSLQESWQGKLVVQLRSQPFEVRWQVEKQFRGRVPVNYWLFTRLSRVEWKKKVNLFKLNNIPVEFVGDGVQVILNSKSVCNGSTVHSNGIAEESGKLLQILRVFIDYKTKLAIEKRKYYCKYFHRGPQRPLSPSICSLQLLLL